MTNATTNEIDQRPVAVVTGAGAPRIGNCVARTLARRGYRLVIHARSSKSQADSTARELEANGVPTLVSLADLRNPAEIRAMFDTSKEHFGRIDALVNCAAVWIRKPLAQTTADDVRLHFEINTLGTFLCCQHAGQVMAAQTQGGAIVNLGDWATARPYPDYAAYFASKGSIPTLTRTFAVELGRLNPRIRVNAILPGPVLLPSGLSAAERRAAIEGTLAKREGSPQNVADAVAFLLENDYITGACLEVDGGRSIFAG